MSNYTRTHSRNIVCMPDDLLKRIFSYLDILDLISLFSSNKYLKEKYFEKIVGIRWVPLEPKYTLYPYQFDAVKWMMYREQNPHRAMRGGILSFDMGLGKTLTSLCASVLQYHRHQTPTLIVCSKNIFLEWKNNIIKFYGKRVRVLFFHNEYINQSLGLKKVFNKINDVREEDLKLVHFVITTYETLTRICNKYDCAERCITRDEQGRVSSIVSRKTPASFITSSELAKRKLNALQGEQLLYGIKWERVIADECHKFSNCKTKLFKTMMALCANYKWGLTGTPVRNDHSDMYSLMRFVGYNDCLNVKEWTHNIFTTNHLSNLCKYLSFDEAKIQLPPKQTNEIIIHLSPEEQKVYDHFNNATIKAYREMELQGGNNFMEVICAFMRMRQSCIDINLIDLKKYSTELNAPRTTSSKIDALCELLSSIDEKVIVFSTFASALKIIEKEITSKLSRKVLRIDGSVNTTGSRDRIIEQFKQSTTHNILLLTYKVGSEGLTLVQSNHVVCVEPWWSPSAEDQAVGRVHRIGQRKPVNVHRLLIDDSIESRIMEICDEKRKLKHMYSTGSSSDTITKEMLARVLGIKKRAVPALTQG